MASGTYPKYADGTDTRWLELPASGYTGTLKYRKIGNLFQIRNQGWIKLNNDLSAGSNVLLGTIPEEYRPPAIFGNAYWNTSPYPILAIKIENGQVRLFNSYSGTITAGTNIMLNVISFV